MSARLQAFALAGGIAALLFCGTASAQTTNTQVIVHVVDPAGAPVSGARVVISARDGAVQDARQTDTAGAARFDALSAGSRIVEVTAPGFARAARTVAVPSDGMTLTLRLELAGVTEQVVVTAAGHQQTASEVAKAVTVIDAGEIAARNEFSVADALRTVPGAAVQQLGGPGAFTSVKLRGLRERDTAILIDGVRFRDAGAPQGDATAFIGELYVANLDRLEVLRGSGSSLYGSHAIGGAVNLITAMGSGRPEGDLSAEAGGLGFSRATAHGSGAAAGERLRFSAGAARTRTLRGVDGDDDARNLSVQGRVDAQLASSALLSVRVYGSDGTSAQNEPPAAVGPLPASGFVEAGAATFVPAVNDPDSLRDGSFASSLALFEHQPTASLGYTVLLHHLRTKRTYRDGPLGTSPFEPAADAVSRFTGTIDTLTARVHREWSAHHATTAAWEFERERYVSDSLPGDPALAWTADITEDSHTASVQHEMRFDALQVAGSLRAQRFGLDRVALAPAQLAPFAAGAFASPPAAVTADAAAVRWIEATGTKLRAHVGNAYRAPAMFERAGVSFGSFGYTVYGDPALGPERSVSVDAGVDQTLLRGRALISATWFHTRLTRVIAFQSFDPATDPVGRFAGYANADGRTARGVELSARVQPHPALEARVAYTFADAPPPDGDRSGLRRASGVPAHQLSALLMSRVNRLEMSLEVEAAGDHYVTLFDPVSFGSRAYRFAGLTKADVAASYRLSRSRARVRVFGTIENLFDNEYFVQGFRTAGRVARAGLTVGL